MGIPRLGRTIGAGVALTAAVAVGYRCLTLPPPPPSAPVRVPALDDRRVQAWLDSDRIVVGPRDSFGPPCSDFPDDHFATSSSPSCMAYDDPQLTVVDLATGHATKLPQPPVGDGSAKTSRPRVSPDGRWALYLQERWESQGTSGLFHEQRWWLVPTKGGAMRSIPSNGAFQKINGDRARTMSFMESIRPFRGKRPRGFTFAASTRIEWHPDSRGWTLQCRFSDKDDRYRSVYERYRLDAPERPAETSGGGNDWDWLGDDAQGRHIRLSGGRDLTLTLNEHPLALPAGRRLALFCHMHGCNYPTGHPRLAPWGTEALVPLQTSPDGGTLEIWSFPLGPGAPRRRWVVPPDVGIYSLSPDGTRVIYSTGWDPEKAFLQTWLPTPR